MTENYENHSQEYAAFLYLKTSGGVLLSIQVISSYRASTQGEEPFFCQGPFGYL